MMCKTVADENGAWSCNPTIDLADGEHNARIVVIDEMGYQSNTKQHHDGRHQYAAYKPTPPADDQAVKIYCTAIAAAMCHNNVAAA